MSKKKKIIIGIIVSLIAAAGSIIGISSCMNGESIHFEQDVELYGCPVSHKLLKKRRKNE